MYHTIPFHEVQALLQAACENQTVRNAYLSEDGVYSLGVLLGGGGVGESFNLLTFFLVISVSEDLGGGLGLILILGGILLLGFSLLLFVLLLSFGVSVHEEIDHEVPGLVSGDLSSELEDLSGEEPDGVSDGVDGLVVGGDGNIDPVHGGIGITKSNDGDVHVGGFLKTLVVHAGVADNDESGLKEFLGVMVSKSSGNPLSTEVVRSSGGGELEDSSLGVRSAGDDLLLSKRVRKGRV
jgi:hypothetical protein